MKPTLTERELQQIAKPIRTINRAADALVRWRRAWERTYARGPTEGNGQSKEEIALWKIAGQLMRDRGIKTRLP